jgi:hypothetical protein
MSCSIRTLQVPLKMWINAQPVLACRQLEAFGCPIEKLVSLLKPQEAKREDLHDRAAVGANSS